MLREYWMQRGTTEGLTRLLEQSPKVSWYIDEGSALINSWDRYTAKGAGAGDRVPRPRLGYGIVPSMFRVVIPRVVGQPPLLMPETIWSACPLLQEVQPLQLDGAPLLLV